LSPKLFQTIRHGTPRVVRDRVCMTAAMLVLTVVPEPPNGSSTIPPRREQSLMASATS
jgi:hypothetical protein